MTQDSQLTTGYQGPEYFTEALAVATISRDRESLQAELAMEGHGREG